MRKFGNVVANEYIKVLLKRSTVVMLITVVLIALGYNGLMYLDGAGRTNWYYTYSYDEEINWVKADKYDGWEQRVELLTYLRDNDISNFFLDDDYWRYDIVQQMFSMRSVADELAAAGETIKAGELSALAGKYEDAVQRKDWRAYYKAALEYRLWVAGNEEPAWGVSSLEIDLWALEYKIKNDIPPFYTNWKNSLVENIKQDKIQLLMQHGSKPSQQDNDAAAELEDAILLGEYRLDNDLKAFTSKSTGVFEDSSRNWFDGPDFWGVFTTSALGINVVSVLIIIIAGSVISSEFSTGTVKYLLVNPVKRYKIFIAKYVSVLSFALLMLFVFYIFNMLLAGCFFGFGDIGAPYIYVSNGEVLTGSSLMFVASKYLAVSVGMICMATFAFAISSVSKSSAISIGLGVFLYLSGYGVAAIMSALRLNAGRYLIFSNLELNAIAEGEVMFRGQTLPFAMAVIAVYMFVFLLTAWDGFVRRDVK